MPRDIVKCLYNACHFAIENDHLNALDWYLQVAMGDKAWGYGINVLGVHERTGKSRLFVTYILRELSRPYEQSGGKNVTDIVQTGARFH